MLDKFAEQDFYEEHPVVWYLTEQRAYKIELLATFVTPSDSDSYKMFDEPAELEAYLAEALGKSKFKTAADTQGVERIMTLSTCAYHAEDGRFIVVAKKTDPAA